jgi:flavin reductase (DIM6/NTAB) family NADH-FMN oxidoreductase RutF
MTGETFTPDAATARQFRAALGNFATGVTLVTAASPTGPMGFTANSFSSVSLDPPLVLWSAARSSSRFATFADARFYTIHVLGAEQAPLIARFARGGDGFTGLPDIRSPDGVPLLDAPLARFDCEQYATYDGGDHLMILGRVLRAAGREGDPLVFAQGHFVSVMPPG